MGALTHSPPPARRTGYDCTCGRFDHDTDDRATLAAWLDDPNASDAWIAEQLTGAYGLPIGYQVVSRHRLGRCVACQRAGRTWHG